MPSNRLAFALYLCVAGSTALAQQPALELRYDPPPNFYHSAFHPPEDYSANEFNASLQVYPFRTFNGNLEQLFQQTLVRDWIDVRFREESVAGRPEFGKVAIRGAQAAYTARFVESNQRQHLRMLIVVGNAAAVVDASANNPATWQRAVPALNAFSATLRVEAAQAISPVIQAPGPAGTKMAGLYRGSKAKYVVDLNKPVGYGKHVAAFHYYLFSAGGRVYRAYDVLDVPGGDPDRFDFDAAQRNDPGNSGRYTVKDNQLVIQLNGQPSETIKTAAPQGNRVTIDTVLYVRQ